MEHLALKQTNLKSCQDNYKALKIHPLKLPTVTLVGDLDLLGFVQTAKRRHPGYNFRTYSSNPSDLGKLVLSLQCSNPTLEQQCTNENIKLLNPDSKTRFTQKAALLTSWQHLKCPSFQMIMSESEFRVYIPSSGYPFILQQVNLPRSTQLINTVEQQRTIDLSTVTFPVLAVAFVPRYKEFFERRRISFIGDNYVWDSRMLSRTDAILTPKKAKELTSEELDADRQFIYAGDPVHLEQLKQARDAVGLDICTIDYTTQSGSMVLLDMLPKLEMEIYLRRESNLQTGTSHEKRKAEQLMRKYRYRTDVVRKEQQALAQFLVSHAENS